MGQRDADQRRTRPEQRPDQNGNQTRTQHRPLKPRPGQTKLKFNVKVRTERQAEQVERYGKAKVGRMGR